MELLGNCYIKPNSTFRGEYNESMRGPLRWFGGKGHLTKILLYYVVEYKVYTEPFGGGCSLLFAKPISKLEVINDVNEGLINFFRVLRDPKKFAKFYHLACLTPYSRAEYYLSKSSWESCKSDIERAYKWFLITRMCFSGDLSGGWSYDVASDRCVSAWLSILKDLPIIAERMLKVQIECLDFREFIPKYDSSELFLYADPPYVIETRSSTRYKNDLKLQDHVDLINILLKVKGMVILSAYEHSVYQPLLDAGWQIKRWDTSCYAAGRTRPSNIMGKGSAISKLKRTEVVYLNPNLCNKLGSKNASSM